MRIGIGVPRAQARQWLVVMQARLEAEGHQVSFHFSHTPSVHSEPLLQALQKFEARLYGAQAKLSQLLVDPPEHSTFEDVDLFIAIGADIPSAGRVFRLFVGDRPGIEYAIPSLLDRRIPLVEFRDEAGAVIVTGLPAIEEPEVLSSALDWFFWRLITFIELAVARADTREPARAVAHKGGAVVNGPLLFGAGTFLSRLIRRLNGRRWSDEHWSIGIRPRAAHLPTGILDPRGFSWIRDDTKRYYADPVLFDHEGRSFLFLEEFPYFSAKGVISFAELDASGTVLATPEVILESTGHLSYPFLFRHNGDIYMMPENAAENRLPLYRAERFPDRWIFAGNLLEDTRIHDATMFVEGGRCWLLANSEGGGGSSWDCLSLYSAPSPLGPFTPSPANPVLIDTRFSRSGGPILDFGGQIVRPVQCCLGTYGRALRFMAVDRFEDGAFEQRQIGILEPPPGGAIRGVHTYARSQHFEAIDARGRIPKE